MSAMPAIPYPEETPSPKTYPAKAVAAHSQTSGMSAITIPRRTPQPKDVQIDFLCVYDNGPRNELVHTKPFLEQVKTAAKNEKRRHRKNDKQSPPKLDNIPVPPAETERTKPQ